MVIQVAALERERYRLDNVTRGNQVERVDSPRAVPVDLEKEACSLVSAP